VRLLAWLESFGPIDAVGVEGTGSYGAGLARFLTVEQIAVIEVDRSDRKARRDHSKSDPLDAEAAARAVLSGRAAGTPKTRDGLVESIRVLQVVYRSAVSARTATINQFHAMVTAAPAKLREQLRWLSRDKQLERARRFRSRDLDDQVTASTRQALRALAQRVAFLTEQAQQVEDQLDGLTEQAAPALRDVHGVGVHTAATLLVTVGDNPQRIRSEAALARICGVSPIPASSGQTQRHRLNRGGNRAANHALWRIAMVRMTSHPPTRSYVARRRSEGLSTREIIRCLKRYIVREIYQTITATSTLAPRGPELRTRRHELALPLRVAATRGRRRPRHSHLHPVPPRAQQDPRPRTRHPHPRLVAPPTTSPDRRLTTIGASRLHATSPPRNSLLRTTTPSYDPKSLTPVRPSPVEPRLSSG
jgi:transposase